LTVHVLCKVAVAKNGTLLSHHPGLGLERFKHMDSFNSERVLFQGGFKESGPTVAAIALGTAKLAEIIGASDPRLPQVVLQVFPDPSHASAMVTSNPEYTRAVGKARYANSAAKTLIYQTGEEVGDSLKKCAPPTASWHQH
jgi:hypothetical protein